MTSQPKTALLFIVQPIWDFTRTIFAKGRRGSRASPPASPNGPNVKQDVAQQDAETTSPQGRNEEFIMVEQPPVMSRSPGSSQDEYISPMDPKIAEIAKFQRRYLKLSDIVRTQRRQAHYKRSDLESNFRHLHTSLEHVKAELATPDSTRLGELSRTLLEDLQRVEDGIARLNEAENLVNTWEQRLEKTLTSLTSAAETDLDVEPLDDDADDADDALTSDSHSETPTLLREYYDEVGKEGYLRERLNNAILNYHEELADRERLRDQEQEPETPDEVLNQEFEDRVRDLNIDIQAASSNAEALAARCREEGLQIATRPHLPGDDDADDDDCDATSGVEGGVRKGGSGEASPSFELLTSPSSYEGGAWVPSRAGSSGKSTAREGSARIERWNEGVIAAERGEEA